MLARNRARIQAAQDFDRVLASDPLPALRVPPLPDLSALQQPQFQVPTADQMHARFLAELVARLKAQAVRSRLRLKRPPNLGSPGRLPRDPLGPSVLLGALGELLGSVAVLATLVYLALQTRQTTMPIGAQLDAAFIAANQNLLLTPATSSELQEALDEDRIVDVERNQVRRALYWSSFLISLQWSFHQGRHGLLPTFNEAAQEAALRGLFKNFRSFGGWWETSKHGHLPEFVAWVEEQRSKAA